MAIANCLSPKKIFTWMHVNGKCIHLWLDMAHKQRQTHYVLQITLTICTHTCGNGKVLLIDEPPLMFACSNISHSFRRKVLETDASKAPVAGPQCEEVKVVVFIFPSLSLFVSVLVGKMRNKHQVAAHIGWRNVKVFSVQMQTADENRTQFY